MMEKDRQILGMFDYEFSIIALSDSKESCHRDTNK